jgi:hypothetical protein
MLLCHTIPRPALQLSHSDAKNSIKNSEKSILNNHNRLIELLGIDKV